MIEKSDCVDECTPTTIDDLLQLININNQEMGWVQSETNKLNWVFRGHEEASWKLEPSSVRLDDSWSKIFDKFKRFIEPDVSTAIKRFNKDQAWSKFPDERLKSVLYQTAFEEEIVYRFIQLSDSVNLNIPKGPSNTSGRKFLNSLCRGSKAFGDDHNHNKPTHIALAQHSQIPTKMLDWTGDPLFALFFALESKNDPNSKENAVIWALDSKVLEKKDAHVFNDDFNNKELFMSVSFFRSLMSDILNIRSQNGILQYLGNREKYYLCNGEWPCLEKVLHYEKESNKPLRKIVIKNEWVSDLNKILWIRGINRAAMMPSFENIGKALSKILIQTDFDNFSENQFENFLIPNR